MVERDRSVCVPYGAYELKATYQRNMGFGMVGATIVFALAALAPHIAGMFFGETTVVIPIEPSRPVDSICVIIRPDPPPTVIRDQQVRVAPPENVILTGNVVAVNDTLISDQQEPVMANQDELRAWLGPGAQTGDGAGDLGIRTNDTGDAFPEPTEFLPMEIQPALIAEVKPDYPISAQRLGVSGKVWLQVLLDKDGKVREVRVARTSGFDVLDQAAMEAAHKNTFKPGIQNGTPVPCWITYSVEFKISD